MNERVMWRQNQINNQERVQEGAYGDIVHRTKDYD